MSRIIRIVAVATLIVLGVATAIKAKAGPVIVTASPIVTATPRAVEPPVVHVRHAPRIEREHEAPDAKPAEESALARRLKTPWSLPVSCAKAKWYMDRFSEATLETMRKAAGLPAPTRLQKQQGRDCQAGLRSD